MDSARREIAEANLSGAGRTEEQVSGGWERTEHSLS